MHFSRLQVNNHSALFFWLYESLLSKIVPELAIASWKAGAFPSGLPLRLLNRREPFALREQWSWIEAKLIPSGPC